MSYIVPDLLAPGLTLVFCGSAPSRISASAKAYYANPGNLFWTILHRSGITPEKFSPHDYPKLLSLGIGLTDLCKTEFGNDDELPECAIDPEGVRAKLLRYQPKMVAFTSKNVGQIFFGRKCELGLQEETIGKTQAWVMPSTSGRARRFWKEDVWLELGEAYAAALSGTNSASSR